MGKRVFALSTDNKFSKKKKITKKRRVPMLVRDVNEQAAIGLTTMSLRRTMNPKSFKCTLRYQEDILQVNPAPLGLAGSFTFGANCIYDPYLGVGGHQPMGFDYYMNFYKYAVVLKATISVRFQSSDGTYNNVAGIHLTENSAGVTDARAMIENGNTVFDVVTNTALNEGNQKLLSLEYSPKTFWGSSIDKLDTLQYNTVSGNPGRIAAFVVFCAPLQSVDAGGVTALVTLDYDVEFYTPFEQAGN